MKETEYVLLKLQSGDEIVAKKSGVKKGFIVITRPLLLQRTTLLDPITGNVKKNICIFRDWLEFTTNLECELAVDSIILTAIPSPDIIKRYEKELDLLDRQIKGEIPKPSASKNTSKMDLEEAENLLDEYFKTLKGLSPKDQPKLPTNPLGFPPSPPQNNGMVTATFSIPPDVFLNIVLNMPLFDSWGQDMGDDSTDMDDGGDDDSEGEPPSQKPKPPKKKPNKDEDTPPDGWNGRFGFPK